ncbi:MAG: phosphoribosylanthranilate isomerase [Cyanobacteria bacterium P01_G01_bin.19]
MRVKICGITQLNQALAIVNAGANSLGFICVERSPRYIAPPKIQKIAIALPAEIDKVGVFADAAIAEILDTVEIAHLTSVQLHGAESPEFCALLRQALPESKKIEIIKAFRIKGAASLTEIEPYIPQVDTLLLDAYHPQLLGGTGHTIDWQDLEKFAPSIPWLLAGGLNPDNIKDALSRLKPDGIDLSSGVELAPGNKDLTKITQLFKQLAIVR